MSGYEFIETENAPIKAWIKGVPLEEAAAQQLRNVAGLPFVHSHVCAMPDVHRGMGATVGSVIPTKGAIIPAAVGVDIGCGMMAVQTTLTSQRLPDSLAGLRSRIEEAVPIPDILVRLGARDAGGTGDAGLPDGKTASEVLSQSMVQPSAGRRFSRRSPQAAHTLRTDEQMSPGVRDKVDRLERIAGRPLPRARLAAALEEFEATFGDGNIPNRERWVAIPVTAPMAGNRASCLAVVAAPAAAKGASDVRRAHCSSASAHRVVRSSTKRRIS